MDQNSPQPELTRLKAFWLAIGFEWVCLGLAFWLYLTLEQPLLFVAAAVIGGAPLIFVIYRYAQRSKTVSSNPKIVE
jgi:hypothetical protein